MIITNDTKAWQIAELMGEQGDEIDELDGCIMLSILRAECVTDTEEVSDEQWLKYLQWTAEERREADCEDAESMLID